MNEERQGSLTAGLLIAFLMQLVLWSVRLLESALEADFAPYGLMPRHWDHIYGILTMPFIHGDWWHLAGNSVPLFVLSLLAYTGYPHVFFRTTAIIILVGGLGTWIIGRENYHIGASGMVYGYASFLFFAGILSRNFRMMAVSGLVVYLYGQMFWGIFPIRPEVSWEGHLCGAVAGLGSALVFYKQLPRRKKYDWENEPDEEEEGPPVPEQTPGQKDEYLIRYYYKEVNKDNDENGN